MMPKPEMLYWRVGRKVGRTIYAILNGTEPSDDDFLIGMMDTQELAENAVSSHNAILDWTKP